MTQPMTPKTSSLIPVPGAMNHEERLKEIMARVYELLDEARGLIPFFTAVVKYEGKLFWAELQLTRNPMNYPDINEYYWQSKFGLPNAHGFWFDLYELKRDYEGKPIEPHRPHPGRDKNKRPTLTTGNAFDALRPSLNSPKKLDQFEVIKKIK